MSFYISWCLFQGLFNIFKTENVYHGSLKSASTKFKEKRRKLSMKEEFILALVRLRLGLLGFVLAGIFGIAESSVSRIFTTWMTFLSDALQPLRKWPSRRKIQKNMPKAFRDKYPRTRAIIDCTEFFIERPRKNSKAQSTTYSHYKSHNTFKALVSISPTGAFTFVSPLWGGNVSDRYLTEKSGFLDLCEKGDDIMADRGFTIRDLLLKKGATLNIPPFTRQCSWGNKKVLTTAEIRQTRNIAGLRIHVERAIGRLKNFRLLTGVLPLTLQHIANQMLFVAASLCNLLPPLVK